MNKVSARSAFRPAPGPPRAAGKEVILTDRGRPIAVITPIKDEGSREAMLDRMAEQGLITVAARKGRRSVSVLYGRLRDRARA